MSKILFILCWLWILQVTWTIASDQKVESSPDKYFKLYDLIDQNYLQKHGLFNEEQLQDASSLYSERLQHSQFHHDENLDHSTRWIVECIKNFKGFVKVTSTMKKIIKNVLHVDRYSDTVCYLKPVSRIDAIISKAPLQEYEIYQVGYIPNVLKIHPDIFWLFMACSRKQQQTNNEGSNVNDQIINDFSKQCEALSEGNYEINVEFHSVSDQILSESIIETTLSMMNKYAVFKTIPDLFLSLSGMQNVMNEQQSQIQRYLFQDWLIHLEHSLQFMVDSSSEIFQHAKLNVESLLPRLKWIREENRVRIVGIALQSLSGTEMISYNCILANFIMQVSQLSLVKSINFEYPYQIIDTYPSSLLQSYARMNLARSSELPTEYTDHQIGKLSNRLHGKGQIIGIADTGMDLKSCFFANGNQQILEYITYADDKDDFGGHGTHVTSTVIGHSNSSFQHFNGAAYDAKIVFVDIEKQGNGVLSIPNLMQLLTWFYNSSAKIHSHSWGTFGMSYNYMNYIYDKFLYEHDEVVIFYAAGNNGIFGPSTINNPANGKNIMAVGCLQDRNPLTDFPYSTPQTSISTFSSMGPTYDKRIKPDLVAGGDYIMAALANDKDQPTCSVHAMSGTSMATPRVAASALLVRELLMNNTILQEFCNQFFPFDNADHNNAVLNKPCWYNQDIQKPPEPSGYLLKTILTHSTIPVSRYSMDLYNAMGFKYYPNSFPLKAPPDNIQGFGQSDMMDYMDSCVNTDSNQVLMLFDRLLIESYSSIDFMLKIDSNYISSSPSELKVTLSWYDPPHTIGFADKWLIHDLDLVINAPCGETFNGNENYLRDNNYKNEEGDFKDENNNIEQIRIPLQASSCDNNDNVYKVSVISNALPYNVTQSFALVISAPAGVIVSQNDEASHKILNRPSTNISRSSEAHLRSRSRNTQQEDCNNFVREVGFQDLLLEIRLNVVTDVSFQPVIKLLEEFHAIGSFQGISLHISDQSKTVTDRYIVGSDAFMFTVIITDPSGNQAQIGGLGWLHPSNHTFVKRLPDIWMAVRTPPPFLQFHDEELNQRPLSGTDSYWSAYRDAKDAELSAISRDVNPWKIEVAMGYNRAVRVPILYSGKLILYFKNCSDERYSQNNSNSLQYSLESSLLQQPSEVVPNWRSDDNDDRTQNYNSSFNQPKWIIMFLCLQALLFLSSILLCRLCARTRTQNAFSKLRGQYTALNQIEEECRSLNSESYQGYNFLESNQPTINDDVLVEGRSTTSTSGDEFASNPVKIDFGHYPILGVLLTTLSSSCSSVDQSLDQRQLSSHQLGSGDLTEKEMKKNDQSYGSCI